MVSHMSHVLKNYKIINNKILLNLDLEMSDVFNRHNGDLLKKLCLG
jgi:hypothetical protein